MGPFLFSRLRWVNVSAGPRCSAGVTIHDEALPGSVTRDGPRLSGPPQPFPVEQYASQVAADDEAHETEDDTQAMAEKHPIDIGARCFGSCNCFISSPKEV